MKKYLVTGGAGFIGSNFVKYLIDNHAPQVGIIVLDALTYAGNILTIKDLIDSRQITFIKGDINDRPLVDKILADHDPDYIVNFAAESHVDRSISNPRLFLETNILGTQTLLDAALAAWRLPDNTYRHGKKFLQISTDEVYGSLPKTHADAVPLTIDPQVAQIARDRNNITTFGDTMFTETTPLAPRSPYSASKASADLITLAYHHTYGLPVNITRCSNNYGPAQFPEKLIPLLINNILTGRPLPVYGKGLNVRDWLYVTDHCHAIDLVLRSGADGRIYNIGGFNEQQNIDIVNTVIDTMASRLDPERTHINTGLITYVTDRPGHDMRYAIDPHRIAVELGWYPATPFTRGIIKTVDWYLDNPEWVKSVTSGQYLDYYRTMYQNR